MSLKFGDLFTNPTASAENPHKHGFFVRESTRSGRLNPGKFYEFTDQCGNFWSLWAKDVESALSQHKGGSNG